MTYVGRYVDQYVFHVGFLRQQPIFFTVMTKWKRIAYPLLSNSRVEHGNSVSISAILTVDAPTLEKQSDKN